MVFLSATFRLALEAVQAYEYRRMSKIKPRRSVANFGTLDDFLKDEGKLEEFRAVAIREVLAYSRRVRATRGKQRNHERAGRPQPRIV
jgi:hypothetical protein